MDDPKNDYEIIECQWNFAYTLTFNTIMTPLLVGYPLFNGGICPNRHSFDYISFDEDAKAWVKDNNINRELILKNYSSLISVEIQKNNILNNYEDKQNEILNTMYKKFSKEYAIHPKIKKHIIDLSSLYKKELLTSKVTFIENKLDKKNIYKSGQYRKLVNNAFPCKSTTQCVSNMKEATQAINKKSLIDMKNLQTKFSKYKSDYKKTLREKTKYLKLDYKKDLQSDTFNNKTIYYKVIAKDTVDSHAKKLNVTYKILYMDYKNIFPSYKNTNKDISISFDPKSHTILYSNLTNNYIQIKSVNLYYNNDVYGVQNSNNKEYSSELSPQTSKSIQLNQYIPNSTFKHVTKSKALSKKILFGFAIKYTIGNTTNNKTLYKRDKTNLYSLIKNK
jgi:hypothetical protein